MKSYADALRQKNEYENDSRMSNLTGRTKDEARIILTSRGGKNAAKLALADLYAAYVQFPDGWLVTARIRAPLRVLNALELTGLIERAEGTASFPTNVAEYEANRSHAYKYRLTEFGRQVANESKGKS